MSSVLESGRTDLSNRQYVDNDPSLQHVKLAPNMLTSTHMTQRTRKLAVFAALWLMPAAASAQIHQVGSSSPANRKQTLNFTFGIFALKGVGSRPTEDILYQDLQPPQPLLFSVSDLNGFPVGGEFVYGFARHLEAGVGITYYSRTAHS